MKLSEIEIYILGAVGSVAGGLLFLNLIFLGGA